MYSRTLGLDRAECGPHSMHRIKAALIYRRTKNQRTVQLLLGYSKLESTVRYLGIEVDDALEISEQTPVAERTAVLGRPAQAERSL
jgi:site-specific recombinase XerC